MVGKTLLHYEITASIGKGGMGEVFRARDTKLGRDVAIKILPPDMSGDPEREARFQREARALEPLMTARAVHDDRAGGCEGNKGSDVTRAAIEMANLCPALAKAPRPEDA